MGQSPADYAPGGGTDRTEPPAGAAAGSLAPDDLSLDYIYLRKAIGVIAFLLPIIVVVGKWVLDRGAGFESSISYYYYTHSRNFFVGSLCALAVFFLSYDHRRTDKYKADNWASNIASACALGVAFLPTTRNTNATTAEKVVGTVHLISAASLFVILGVFAVYFFRMSDAVIPTPQKGKRNRLYLACGLVIFLCILSVIVSEFAHPPARWNLLFWLETLMVWAFAVSWLVKGGFWGILVDEPLAARPWWWRFWRYLRRRSARTEAAPAPTA